MLDRKGVYLDFRSDFWKAWDTYAHVETEPVTETGILMMDASQSCVYVIE